MKPRFSLPALVVFFLALALLVALIPVPLAGQTNQTIQRALSSFLTQAHSWTLLQTFNGSIRSPFQNFNASSVLTSGATIAPTNGIHHVSGTAAIGTITVPAACTPTCVITLVPDGIFTTTTGGNVSLASTAVVGRALIMTWDGTKWNPSY